MITGKNYIGNELVANGNLSFTTFNPIKNEPNPWKFIEATSEEVNLAVQKSSQAFNLYRKSSPESRAYFLRQIKAELILQKETILEFYVLESGLNQMRAEAELKRTLDQLEMFADFLIEQKSIFRINQTLDLEKKHLPIGPVVVFGASNFPLAYSTIGGDSVSALAAGCPIIVKSHPMHAGVGEIVSRAIVKAAVSTNMPDGVFSNLNCGNHRVGAQLVEHPLVKAVGFTGSLKGGRALLDLANKRINPIPVFAEMGSVNPIVISQSSIANKRNYWSETIVNSMTQSSGQFCTSPGLILAVDCPELESFSQKLVENIELQQNDWMLGPSIKSAFLAQKQQMMEEKGITILSDRFTNEMLLSEPTLLQVEGSVFISNPKFQEEVFGSFAILVRCKTQQELLNIIENLAGQLTGTVILEEEEHEAYGDLIESFQYKVGRLIFNGVPTGVKVEQNMHHGGPYPASTDSRFTAVGQDSIYRWLRPVCYQNRPIHL